MIARTILFMMVFANQDEALNFAATVTSHLFKYQKVDVRLMGNKGGHA